MALTLVNGGETSFLKAALGHTNQQTTLKLKLYKAISPALSETTVVGELTECDFSGYAEKTLTGASWSVTGDTGSYAQQTFTHNGGGTSNSVIGYYITDGTSLLWIEAFSDGPYTIANNGDAIKVTPSITMA